MYSLVASFWDAHPPFLSVCLATDLFFTWVVHPVKVGDSLIILIIFIILIILILDSASRSSRSLVHSLVLFDAICSLPGVLRSLWLRRGQQGIS